MTKELYKYFVQTSSFNGITHININTLDMILYDVHAVNKIENVIIQNQTVTDSKSNIIQPVFYRAIETPDIILYPEVTDTICINLDQYKSKVNAFIIQVEGIKFNEIGRNSKGVLFKIQGKKLPQEITSGQYYILDQDSELVTLGKFSYA